MEVAVVALIADPAFRVLPMRGDAFLRHPVHFDRSNLHLERCAVLTDHRGVQRLIAVRPGHRDEILDASGYRRPGLMDDAECRITVLHRFGDDPDSNEVVHLLEFDLLAPEFLVDAP